MRYLLSSKIGTERLPKFKEGDSNFGRAHYSWKINANLYLRAIQALRQIKEIDAPDIYQHPIAREIAGIQDTDVHLADKPIESLRPLFGNKNVAIEVWEFPEVSTRSHCGDPRLNQVAMLRKFDAVWCGSSFTAETMRNHGINAIHLPPPVAHFVTKTEEELSNVPAVRLNSVDQENIIQEDILEIIEPDKHIYLCILAPYDRRKNLRNLIEGFLMSKAHRNSILLIKLILDNNTTTVANINQILRSEFGLKSKSSNVIFIGAYLSSEQMTSLYKRCSFFISAASAEGLNLPLIEAMAHERPVIAPNNTAMRDYIMSDHAVVLGFNQTKAAGPIHALHEYIQTTHFPPSAKQVAAGFDYSSQISNTEAAEIGRRGSAFVNDFFGLENFEARLNKFEQGI